MNADSLCQNEGPNKEKNKWLREWPKYFARWCNACYDAGSRSKKCRYRKRQRLSDPQSHHAYQNKGKRGGFVGKIHTNMLLIGVILSESLEVIEQQLVLQLIEQLVPGTVNSSRNQDQAHGKSGQNVVHHHAHHRCQV